MTCQELTDFLSDYLDNGLPPEVRAEFEAHLAVCRDCRNYLDSYRKTIALSQAALRQPVDPDEVPEQLVEAILKARRVPPRS